MSRRMLPGWDAPTRDWDHPARQDQGRLVWYAVLALLLLAVAAVMIPNDDAPGIGRRSWLALAVTAGMCWRLTLARNTSLTELLVKVGEWASVVMLLVLLACATAGDSPQPATSPPARPPAATPARPQAARPERSALDQFGGAVVDAWRRAFRSPTPGR